MTGHSSDGHLATSGHRCPLGETDATVVTKKAIVQAICNEVGLSREKVKDAVQMTLDAVISALVKHGRIELRVFCLEALVVEVTDPLALVSGDRVECFL